MQLQLNDAERDFLRYVLACWVDEGFATPPYDPEFYDVAEKVGLTEDDVTQYDIRRPSSPK